MAKCSYNGESIECSGAEVISNKITYSAVLKLDNVGNCASFIGREPKSEAKIISELSPKKPICNPLSKVDLNDDLEGEHILIAIRVADSDKISIKKHDGGGQKANTSAYTYAEITKQLPTIGHRPEYAIY